MKIRERLRAMHRFALSFLMVNLSKFARNERAAVQAKDVIYAAVGFLLVAVLTPVGMNQVGKNSNWTKWDTTVATIFTILVPILYLIGVALYFIKDAT
jgi:Na+/melibiose symporter-like transporter